MRRITVVPHDPAWQAAFEAASAEVREALDGNLVALHHIGSTAIPGIYAKPVIDMLLVVNDLTTVDERTPRIVALGYVAMGEFGIEGRRYFRRDNAAGDRTHQIHAFTAGPSQIERHLAFRDYMRSHPGPATEYSRLKQALAAAHPDNIDAYMDGKDGFIKEHQEKAMQWAAARATEGQ